MEYTLGSISRVRVCCLPAEEAIIEGETELEMVRRHVREGKGHLRRQGELIARLQKQGAPTDMAVALLEQFTDYQRQHEEHLARLQPGYPANATSGMT